MNLFFSKRTPKIIGKVLLISGFLLIILYSFNNNNTRTQASQASVLDVKVKSFSLEASTMEEALSALRQQNKKAILIGFEEAAKVGGVSQSKPIMVDVSEGTVKEVLDDLVRDDPRYDYEITKNQIINVFPVGAKNDSNNLLNIKVSRVYINGRYSLISLIRRSYLWMPELRIRMDQSYKEYRAKTGIGLRAIDAGAYSGMPWNEQSTIYPSVEIELHDLTVREILNELILYSAMNSPNEDWTPISWKYEFLIDVNAPTGLRGYPGWGQIGREIPQEIFW